MEILGFIIFAIGVGGINLVGIDKISFCQYWIKGGFIFLIAIGMCISFNETIKKIKISVTYPNSVVCSIDTNNYPLIHVNCE